MIADLQDKNRNPFWQGWKRPSRMFPEPRPLNHIFSGEFALSDGHALFVEYEKIASLDSEEWGWRNEASSFTTIDHRTISGYIYLFWDVLLLLAAHPGEIVETHRGDEDFYHSLVWEEEMGTYWIKQWGSQMTCDIRLGQEEFIYIIQEINRAPEGTPYTQDTVDYKGEPTIWHHIPQASDRPDWCEECEHPFAECECLCLHCNNLLRLRSCPVCQKARQNEQWIADRPVKSPCDVLGPDGKRRLWKPRGRPEYLRPFNYGSNEVRGYVASRECMITVCYDWTIVTSQVRRRPHEDPLTNAWFHIKEYRERTLANEILLFAHLVVEAQRCMKEHYQKQSCTIKPFPHTDFTYTWIWDEKFVTIRDNDPSYDGTGLAMLTWGEWERLCRNVHEFRSWTEAGWEKTSIKDSDIDPTIEKEVEGDGFPG